ncbi:MAG: N-acetylneuraminate synthase [Rhodospirillaceae bacterium]|jgi:N-acetylneuraminate synthase|nr:N-acetylneuraminate synthase [Rhodospirillaceae bacterium]
MAPISQPFLIAEIGINHNGDLDLAKQMITAAADAGFDAVKFQKRTIDIVYTADYLAGERESPWGTTQREQKEGLEFGRDEYDEINAFCEGLGLQWTASCWDTESLEFLKSYNPPFHKLASPMLGHLPLVRATAEDGRKTYISTGMSTLEEIEAVVAIFREAGCPFELMHCNSTYPMAVEDANLLCIPSLRDRFDCDVGYSGHETSLVTVCIAAMTLGASSIERHITLDRTMYGSDQAASIETKSLRSFATAIRAIPAALGSGEKKIEGAEMEARTKLRQNVAR